MVSPETTFKEDFEAKLLDYEKQHQGSLHKPWTQEKINDVINNIRRARVSMDSNLRRTSMQYYWMNKYDIIATGNESRLIFKKKNVSEPTVIIVPRNQYFDLIKETHESCGHGGRDKIIRALKTRFYVPKKAVEIFVALCPMCEMNKKLPRRAQPLIEGGSGQYDMVKESEQSISDASSNSYELEHRPNIEPVGKTNNFPSPTICPDSVQNVDPLDLGRVGRTESAVQNSRPDEFDTFGQHVGNQLRSLPLRSAIMCQNYIHNYMSQERLECLSSLLQMSSEMTSRHRKITNMEREKQDICDSSYPPFIAQNFRPDEFDTFGQHMANQLRSLPLQNAIVCQNYVHNHLSQERLKCLDPHLTSEMTSRHRKIPKVERDTQEDDSYLEVVLRPTASPYREVNGCSP